MPQFAISLILWYNINVKGIDRSFDMKYNASIPHRSTYENHMNISEIDKIDSI